MNTTTKTVIGVIIFSIAMAALESAVVVYLRALYYPGEFTVALRLIEEKILLVEIAREAATVIMLGAIGYLCGRNFKDRFAYFLLSFAVWDIFYYIWLKVFINWPATIMDWDILFLIPITWLGPVLAPVICSVSMIVLSYMLITRSSQYVISKQVWSFLLLGCALILYTFIKDYSAILIDNNLLSDYANIMQNETFVRIASSYIPTSFNWAIFICGEGLILIGTFFVYRSEQDHSVVNEMLKFIPKT
ncbi:hypothetical protein [Pseudochryseolinea flava]|uniref:Uncharacterized protein n=1 Tax=Pseudochryseolinea flava TaxID=2059302 RepID=A0A364Y3J2_9BACT|nr:hypothetical protein [Pseudochryseolinea flava]RAW00356.1 hypothetical protein DQQ10_14985 [Pseudochryseolinea flava]